MKPKNANTPLYKTNRYTIRAYEVTELKEAYNDDDRAVLDAAIEIARERARIYHLPAKWEATLNPNGTITVKQYHY